jgi:hypothetical protein
MTMAQFLAQFDKMLRDDFDCCKRGEAPNHSSYPLDEMSDHIALICLWMTKLLDEVPEVKYRRGGIYRVWFGNQIEDHSNAIYLFASVSDDHPLRAYIAEQVPHAFYSVKVAMPQLGTLGSGEELYSGISIKLPDAKAGLDYEVPMAQFMTQLDQVFYKTYEPFFQSLSRLDEIQADRQPEENQSFARLMKSFCLGADKMVFASMDTILDANKRLELIQAAESCRREAFGEEDEEEDEDL